MDVIRKYFDDFVFAARVMPVATVGLPLLVILTYKGFMINNLKETGVNFAIVIVFTVFLPYTVREWGKNFEEKMFEELGGMPTTIVLRFSDDRIGMVSKLKYHRWFNEKQPDILLPLSLNEELEDTDSDQKYMSVMAALRTRANSNRDKFPRVYQELKKYNFWRNLYGCKKLSVGVYVVLMIREILIVKSLNYREILMNPFPKYSIFVGLLAWTIIFCLVVTKRTVKRNAFDYAKTLLEIIEDITAT